MSGRAVALWGAQIRAGENIVSAAEFADLPAPVVITMAAIDPTAEPVSGGPKLATLKIIRRPISSLYDRMGDSDGDSDEDSEDDSEEEEKEEPPKKKKGDKKGESADKIEVDANGKKELEFDDLSDDEDLEGLELEEFVVCTLDTERNYQQPLSLTISDSEDIFFKVTGNYDVYLTGNYIDFSHDHDHDHGDEDDESDEDYDLSPSEDEIYGESDSEDELDDLENPRITELSESEEEISPKKSEKKNKKVDKTEKKAEKKDNKKRAAEETPEKPTEGGKQKKAKANDGKAISVDTPTKKDDQKKVKFAKNLEQGPTPSPAKKKDEKKEQAKKGDDKKPAASSAPRQVKGVTIEDKTTGTGPEAKSGQKVNMRYVGKLTNGKVFDSNTKGKPFSFVLGKGEVIKGWDIGILGMQPGGERRITIPANLAYGKKVLPGIPANSTLVFDVKLLAAK